LSLQLEAPSLRLNWLVSGFAAMLVAFMVFAQRNMPAAGVSLTENPMFAVALSNQSAAAWLQTGFFSSQNRVPVETLGWNRRSARDANGGGSPANRSTN
jgi:hypothetical protein